MKGRSWDELTCTENYARMTIITHKIMEIHGMLVIMIRYKYELIWRWQMDLHNHGHTAFVLQQTNELMWSRCEEHSIFATIGDWDWRCPYKK